jgi:predicted acyltransferase
LLLLCIEESPRVGAYLYIRQWAWFLCLSVKMWTGIIILISIAWNTIALVLCLVAIACSLSPRFTFPLCQVHFTKNAKLPSSLVHIWRFHFVKSTLL